MSINQEQSTERMCFSNLEAAIIEWGGHDGHLANRYFAMDLVAMAAANAGTTFDHAYLTPSRSQVNVVFANSPKVAMTIRVGFVEHLDPTLPGAFVGDEKYKWLNTLLPFNGGRHMTGQAHDAVTLRECACSPGLRQPLGAAECSECGRDF